MLLSFIGILIHVGEEILRNEYHYKELWIVVLPAIFKPDFTENDIIEEKM